MNIYDHFIGLYVSLSIMMEWRSIKIIVLVISDKSIFYFF